jgi:hypothetical protein
VLDRDLLLVLKHSYNGIQQREDRGFEG